MACGASLDCCVFGSLEEETVGSAESQQRHLVLEGRQRNPFWAEPEIDLLMESMWAKCYTLRVLQKPESNWHEWSQDLFYKEQKNLHDIVDIQLLMFDNLHLCFLFFLLKSSPLTDFFRNAWYVRQTVYVSAYLASEVYPSTGDFSDISNLVWWHRDIYYAHFTNVFQPRASSDRHWRNGRF